MKELITYEKPKTITDTKTLFFWYEEIFGKITAGKSKAFKFLTEGLIKKNTNFDFQCLPIKDYNKTTYNITLSNITGVWSCTCQFNRQHGGACSHITAVKIFQFRKDWNDGSLRI